MNVETEKPWTVKQVCEFVGVGKNWVYNKAKEGILPHRKVGRKVVFFGAEIRAWLNQQPGTKGQP